MSREIKFRVYSNCYKKYFDTSGKGIFCEVHHLALKPDGKLYYADIGIDYPGTLSECPTLEWEDDYDDCIVEQYTGLTDKNGEEIYEGDIVEIDEYGKFQIIWNEWACKFDFDKIGKREREEPLLSQDWEEKSEVIGNIHENPELLESE